jgi:hypothetical protein
MNQTIYIDFFSIKFLHNSYIFLQDMPRRYIQRRNGRGTNSPVEFRFLRREAGVGPTAAVPWDPTRPTLLKALFSISLPSVVSASPPPSPNPRPPRPRAREPAPAREPRRGPPCLAPERSNALLPRLPSRRRRPVAPSGRRRSQKP